MNNADHARLAQVEDSLWHFVTLHGHVRRGLLRVGWNGSGRLLDAGCGTGGLLRRLGEWFPSAELEGIDFSPFAVELAARRTGRPIHQGSLMALPFADATFDAITCIDVVTQFDDPLAAYRELARCLRSGGVLVISEPAHRWLWSYHDQQLGAKQRFVRADIVRLVREAGVQPKWSTHWNCLALPLVWLRRRFFPAPETSDVRPYPVWISGPMRVLHGLERLWLSTGAGFPCGTSVFAVGVKMEPGGGAKS